MHIAARSKLKMHFCSMVLQPKQINARYKEHFGGFFEGKFF